MLHFQGNHLLKHKKQTTSVLQIFRRHNTKGGQIMQRKVVVFLNRSYKISMLIVIVYCFSSFIKSSAFMLNERETK